MNIFNTIGLSKFGIVSFNMTHIWIAVLMSFVIREVEDQQREPTRLLLMKQK